MPNDEMAGVLVMADGTVIEGLGGGAPGIAAGELVFQTGMVGYQEALTDPSYAGQILIYTYPLVGNYGAGPAASQRARTHTRGVVVHDLMSSAGHRDSTEGFGSLLRAQGIPALTGIDTRLLTRRVRERGAMPAALAAGPAGVLPPVEELRAIAGSVCYDQEDFVAECSTPRLVWHAPPRPEAARVALIDYGAKTAIIDHLRARGAGVWQVPASMTAGQILALQPDAVLLSNGPGDPACLEYAVSTVRGLLRCPGLPVLGICLGNQLLALAAGGRTSKMRFGHRGINQPVLEVETGRVSITTQNHGFVIEGDSLPADYTVTHTNLNDGTIEGIAHRTRPVWGVQWHPEAHPGPADTGRMFDRFLAAAEAAEEVACA